jgi:hypothetical protein
MTVIHIVEAAIREASPNGETWNYFQKHGSWEAPMRSVFSRVTPAIASDRKSARSCAHVLLYTMGVRYGAIGPTTKINFFYESINEMIEKRGWWNSKPPPLFGSSEVEAKEIAAVVPDSLDLFKRRGDDLTYVLATKWLYFCFPETFAIYDKLAATSIGKVFSRLNFGPNADRLDTRQFHFYSLRDGRGRGYIGMVNFYRSFWSAACASGLDTQLTAVANENQLVLRRQPGCEDARVSTLDILDKLLWIASKDNRDPVVFLGVGG